MRSPARGNIWGTAMLAAALLVTAMGAVSADEPTSPAPSAEARDARLERQIELAIEKDKTLTAQGLDVEVVDGKATLTGTTPTQADRLRAGKLAEVDGVAEVDNQIVVRVTEPPTRPVQKPTTPAKGAKKKPATD